MIDYQRIYHVGILTTGLESAMAEMGASLGVTWCSVQEREMPVRLPEGEVAVPLRFTYSAEGPQHLELLEGAPGSFWDGAGRAGLHHVGVWVDDLASETERLVGAGWTLAASGVGGRSGHGSFTYVQPPSGTIVELVDAAALPRFEAWWAGGEL